MNMDPMVDFTDRIAQQNYKNKIINNTPATKSLLDAIQSNITRSDYPLASMLLEPASETEGLILSYLAQLFREDCSWQIPDLGDFVIATAFIVVERQIRLIVGINAHDRFHRFIPECCRIIESYTDDLNIPIIIVTGTGDYDPSILDHSIAQTRFENYAQYFMAQNWSAANLCWHSEQKIIKYVRKNYPMARKTLTVLGIAHIKGPCTTETAGMGTNRCLEYLQAKTGIMSKSHEYIRTVNAYWFGRTLPIERSKLHFIKPEESIEEGVDIEAVENERQSSPSLSPQRGRLRERSPSPMIRERSFSGDYDKYRLRKMKEREEYESGRYSRSPSSSPERGRYSRSPSSSPERGRNLGRSLRKPLRERSFSPTPRFPTYEAYLDDFYSRN